MEADELRVREFYNRRISVWKGIGEAIAISHAFAFFVISIEVM